MTAYLGENVLRYGLPEGQSINGFKLEMCQVNKELPLMPVQYEYMNGTEALIYRLENRVPLKAVLNDEPKALLLKLIIGIKKLAQCHIYMEDLALELDAIYYSPETQRLDFICLPLRVQHQESLHSLKATFLEIIKVPAFASLVDSSQMAALFDLLYSDCRGQELFERTIHILSESPQRVEAQKPEEKLTVVKTHQIKTVPQNRLKGMRADLMAYALLALGGLVSWAMPISFESKLGITLLCVSLGLLTYQKLNQMPKSTMKQETKQEPKTKTKTKPQKAQPKLLKKPVGTKESLEANVNQMTGEVSFTPYSEGRVMTADRTVLLKEDQMALSGLTLCVEDGVNKMISLQNMQTIGRNSGVCQIAIEHMSVGRIHAELHVNQGRIYIKDLNSLNGTTVNQVKLKPNTYTEVKKGDAIKFGEVKAYLK